MRGLGLDRHDPSVGARRRHRDSGGQPAPTARYDDRLDVGDVLEDLQPHRALAGDHEWIVEGVYEHPSCFLLELRKPLEDISGAGGFDVDLCTVTLRCGALHLARPLIHHDERGEPFERRTERQSRGVVPRRRGDDPA